MTMRTITMAGALALGLILMAMPAGAVAPPATDTAPAAFGATGELLTLAACEQRALALHPAARQAAAAVAAARDGVGIARSGSYPEVMGSAGYRRWETHAFLPAGIGAMIPGGAGTLGPTDDWSAAVRGGWTVWDFGQRDHEVAAAAARVAAAEAGGEITASQLRAAVRGAWFRLLAARAAVGVGRQNRERAEGHVALAERRVAAGAVPQADVLRARVEVADAQRELARLEAGERILAGELNTTIGLPVETPARLAPAELAVGVPDDSAVVAALDRAVAARPELAAAAARITARERQVDAARSAFLPRLRADGAAGVRDDDWAPEDEDWSVGLALQVPIFNGGLLEHNLAQARAELDREAAAREQQVLAVRQEVWTAAARLREAAAAASAAAAQAADAREALRHARERYGVGAGTVSDLLDAQARLARAELVGIQAGYDQALAATAWQRALGEW